MAIRSTENTARRIAGVNAMPAMAIHRDIDNKRADPRGKRETIKHQNFVVIDGMAKIEQQPSVLVEICVDGKITLPPRIVHHTLGTIRGAPIRQ